MCLGRTKYGSCAGPVWPFRSLRTLMTTLEVSQATRPCSRETFHQGWRTRGLESSFRVQAGIGWGDADTYPPSHCPVRYHTGVFPPDSSLVSSDFIFTRFGHGAASATAPDSTLSCCHPPSPPCSRWLLRDALCQSGFATHGCHILKPTAAQACGSVLHGRRNSCPCSWIHLFATGRDKDKNPHLSSPPCTPL